jgi:uncharacterized membrane protein YgaE (UPF0421/DUF939 family)
MVGWQICIWIDPSEPPIYAVVVPLVAMRDHPFSAWNVSFDRLLGVVAGVLLGVFVVDLLGLSVLSVALVLTLGLSVGIILRFGSPSTSKSPSRRCSSSPTSTRASTRGPAFGRPSSAR